MPATHPPIVLVGHARRIVGKSVWRGGPSRVRHRAELADVIVSQGMLETVRSLNRPVSLIAGDDVVGLQGHRRWSHFVLDVSDDSVHIAFRPERGSTSPRDLGRLEVGACIQAARNYRSPAKASGGQMVYVDELWRFWWPRELVAGTHGWPEPTRDVDMRKILH